MEYLNGFIDLSYPSMQRHPTRPRHRKIRRPSTLSLLLICAGNNGGTIRTYSALGTGLRQSRHLLLEDLFLILVMTAHLVFIFAFVLGAQVKLAGFLVTTRVFVVILVAHEFGTRKN